MQTSKKLGHILEKISLALLGKDISHSKSRQMYEEIFKRTISYQLFDYSSENEIPSLDIMFSDIQGLSITAPYKKVFLDHVVLSEKIKPLEAINCIKKKDNAFYGTNTDYEAIVKIFNKNDFHKREIFLLGSGSMAHVTKCFFSLNNIKFTQLSRKENGPLEELDLKTLSKTTNPLIINSCARNFIFDGSLPSNSTFWDYNYSHKAHSEWLPTLCNYLDGLEMLKLQAISAVEFWGLDQEF